MNFPILRLIVLLTTSFGQSLSTNGQLWTNVLTSNDVPNGQSYIESTMGYIPSLSLFKELSDNQLVDIEWTYRLDRAYSGNSLLHKNESHHVDWVL